MRLALNCLPSSASDGSLWPAGHSPPSTRCEGSLRRARLKLGVAESTAAILSYRIEFPHSFVACEDVDRELRQVGQ